MSTDELKVLYEATEAHSFLSFEDFIKFVGDVTDVREILSWFCLGATIH